MFKVLVLLIIFFIVQPISIEAGWIDSPAAEDGISFYGSVSGAISDGFGGVLTCRAIGEGNDRKIHMVKLSSDGEYVWGEEGVPLPPQEEFLYWPGMIAQGDGGVLLSFNYLKIMRFIE